MTKILPGFKTTCLIVGITLILLSLSLFGRGLMVSMSEFGIPEETLNSPHYYDAIFWVYLHMIVIGILNIVLAFTVKKFYHQKWVGSILTLIYSLYTFLDFRSSDSALGNSLYKGEGSIGPAIISLILTLLFVQLTIRLFANKSQS